QLAGQVFNALALRPSNADQYAGYDASMKAQAVAGITLGIYGLADAGVGVLAESGYSLRSPLVLGDVPGTFQQSGAINIRWQSPIAGTAADSGNVNFVTYYRGDATARSEFLSDVAQTQGVDASNAMIAA